MSKQISVKEAAKIMGKSEQFVRIGLQRGLLPFGNAIQMSTIYTYYISPKLFKEYVGEYDIEEREFNNLKDMRKEISYNA
ncbi:hypothetical protein [Clostridium sp.]|uniref:hypothetical protein n=1 Tax=Clostridium sp. TaxID=1506 RepID=UPI0026295178|nr:hypothetical protein [Clostridium sp.]